MIGDGTGASDELSVLVHYQLIAALQEREHDLAEAQRLAHVGSWSWDLATGVVTWSDELYRIVGRAPGAFTPTLESFLALIHRDDRVRVAETIQAAVDSLERYSCDHRLESEGDRRWVRSRAEVDVGADGTAAAMHGTAQDVTEMVVAQRALADLNRRFAAVAHAADAAIVTLYGADGEVLSSTPEGAHTLVAPRSTAAGAGWSLMHPDDVGAVRDDLSRVWDSPGAAVTVRYRMAEADGAWLTYEAKAVNAIDDPAIQGVVVATSEADGLPSWRRARRHRAGTDPLTGLADHSSLLTYMGRALARAARHGWVTAVVVIDIDRFSDVNEAYGEAAGDEVLVGVAARLVESFRASDAVGRSGLGIDARIDAVARFGGDRYVVVCENVAGPEAAAALGQRVMRALDKGIVLRGGRRSW